MSSVLICLSHLFPGHVNPISSHSLRRARSFISHLNGRFRHPRHGLVFWLARHTLLAHLKPVCISTVAARPHQHCDLAAALLWGALLVLFTETRIHPQKCFQVYTLLFCLRPSETTSTLQHFSLPGPPNKHMYLTHYIVDILRVVIRRRNQKTWWERKGMGSVKSKGLITVGAWICSTKCF